MPKDSNVGRQRGRPARLSQDAIVDAAVALLRSSGNDDFSMADLAAALGVTTMALYKHFSNKEAIFDEVSLQIFGEFRIPNPDDPWSDRLAIWIESLRDILTKYPAAKSLIARKGLITRAWHPVLQMLVDIVRDANVASDRIALVCHVTGAIAFGVVFSRAQSADDRMVLGVSQDTDRKGGSEILGGFSQIDAALLLQAAISAAEQYIRINGSSVLHTGLAKGPPRK